MHRYFSLASAAGKPTNAWHAHTSQVQLEAGSYIVGWVTWGVTQNPGYFFFESKGDEKLANLYGYCNKPWFPDPILRNYKDFLNVAHVQLFGSRIREFFNTYNGIEIECQDAKSLKCVMFFDVPFFESLIFCETSKLGGGFKCFLFSILFGEDFQFDLYFSDGLKPPTSKHSFECWARWALQQMCMNNRAAATIL